MDEPQLLLEYELRGEYIRRLTELLGAASDVELMERIEAQIAELENLWGEQRVGQAKRSRPPCSEEDCDDTTTSRGLCRRHYQQWQRRTSSERQSEQAKPPSESTGHPRGDSEEAQDVVEGEVVGNGQHVHHWKLPRPSGPFSYGECECGEGREFANSFEANTWRGARSAS